MPVLLFAASCASHLAPAQDGAHPRLLTSAAGIDSAKKWITEYPWYRSIVTEHKNEIDAFIAHGPVYVSPIKQSYVYQMYTCPNHGIELLYEQFRPFSHRCPALASNYQVDHPGQT